MLRLNGPIPMPMKSYVFIALTLETRKGVIEIADVVRQHAAATVVFGEGEFDRVEDHANDLRLKQVEFRETFCKIRMRGHITAQNLRRIW